MGDRLRANKSWYVTSHPGQLNLAIPPWVSAMSTSESWRVNRHTARYTRPVPVVWQCKLVSDWGLRKRIPAPCYEPKWLGKDFVSYPYLCENNLYASQASKSQTVLFGMYHLTSEIISPNLSLLHTLHTTLLYLHTLILSLLSICLTVFSILSLKPTFSVPPWSLSLSLSHFRTDLMAHAQYTPPTPTPTRRNCFVASASAVWTQFATRPSSRRLPTDSVDGLETDLTDSIAFDYTNSDRYW